MMKGEGLDVNSFITQSSQHLLIDVRAPIEYKKGHIPNAVNIPLFEDEERAEIGTLYKLKGQQIAINRGYELVTPKLEHWVNKVRELSHAKPVFVYCFRGGMRSNSFTWLLNEHGIAAKLLNGGYKNYRRMVLTHFEEPHVLILLGGATGSYKTDILRHIHKQKLLPTIDLEQLANHKGSAFGAIGEKAQTPQQLFENNFYTILKQQASPFLIEDEAMSIGYNKIPYPFWLQMKKAPVLKLMLPFELRLKKIIADYGKASIPVLKESIVRISDQLGGQLAKECLLKLDQNNIEDVARLVLNYYDKAYAFQHQKKTDTVFILIESHTDDVAINATLIKQEFETLCQTLS